VNLRALGVIWILGVAGVASAQSPRAVAEQLYVRGQAAYDRKDFDGALAAWQRSYELSREPGLLFNVAQAFRLRGRDGDCSLATEHYRKFIALDPASPQRAAAAGFITSLESCAARELVASRRARLGPAAESGEPARVPGKPTPPAGASATPASAGEARSPGRGQQITGFGVAGGGLALVATGVYFGARAAKLADEVTARCAMGCTWTEVANTDQRGRTAATLAWVGYGLGAAAVIGGGVLYALGRRADDRSSGISVVARSDGAALTWGGSW
jgi:tetratricopeptide (TPR) repeat protein